LCSNDITTLLAKTVAVKLDRSDDQQYLEARRTYSFMIMVNFPNENSFFLSILPNQARKSEGH